MENIMRYYDKLTVQNSTPRCSWESNPSRRDRRCVSTHACCCMLLHVFFVQAQRPLLPFNVLQASLHRRFFVPRPAWPRRSTRPMPGLFRSWSDTLSAGPILHPQKYTRRAILPGRHPQAGRTYIPRVGDTGRPEFITRPGAGRQETQLLWVV